MGAEGLVGGATASGLDSLQLRELGAGSVVGGELGPWVRWVPSLLPKGAHVRGPCPPFILHMCVQPLPKR